MAALLRTGNRKFFQLNLTIKIITNNAAKPNANCLYTYINIMQNPLKAKGLDSNRNNESNNIAHPINVVSLYSTVFIWHLDSVIMPKTRKVK